MLFRQLQYFVAVAEEGHFARAAARLYVAQPSLSAAITKLEHELGVKLINRGRSYEGLTPEGERLLRWAQRILADHDAFLAEARAVRSGVAGTLRLGVGPTASATAALPIDAFCEQHPLARVRVHENLSAPELRRGLQSFELDAAIGFLPSADLRGLHVEPLYLERYVVAASAELVPAEVTSLGWRDVARLPLAMLAPEMRLRQLIDEVVASQGTALEPQVELESIESLRAHLATGRRASVVPHTLLRTGSAPGIRAIPLVDPVLTADVVLATSSSDVETVITRAFAETTSRLRLDELLGYAPSV